MKKIRVLVTDDSPFYRRLFADILAAQPDIEVAGTADDPYDAREKIKRLTPDVLTLDVEMPKMDGIAFLEKIMTLRPMPVVMVSTLTQKGAEITLQALALGAVDCLAKPGERLADGSLDGFSAALCEKVRSAAVARMGRVVKRPATPLPPLPKPSAVKLIAIGSSTGGVEALHALLPRLPENMPPILIAQHMPPGFTASFAARLNGACRMEVCEAEEGMPLRPGLACVAPGGRHLRVEKDKTGGLVCRLGEDALVSGHRPSVDVLMESAAVLGKQAVGLILTGMGSDGAQGLLKLRRSGALTLGQNESSCVVYGMPRAAALCGAVSRELDLSALAEAVYQGCLG